MPIDNLGKTHFTDAQKQVINNALAQIQAVVAQHTVNLTPKERSKYGKIGARGTLLIDAVAGFHQSMPQAQSPDVDWVEFENDYTDRKYATMVLSQLKSLQTHILSIKILRDHDNKTDALRDYRYAQYKNKFGNQPGYQTKIDKLKQFFSRTGTINKKRK